MPTDLPPDYKPSPKPVPGEGKPPLPVPEPGVDAPAVGDLPEPGGDVVDPAGWGHRPDLPGIDPQEAPAPAGTPTF